MVNLATNDVQCGDLIDLTRYSDLSRAKRVLTHVLKFVQKLKMRLKGKSSNDNNIVIEPLNYSNLMITFIQNDQNKAFS